LGPNVVLGENKVKHWTQLVC